MGSTPSRPNSSICNRTLRTPERQLTQDRRLTPETQWTPSAARKASGASATRNGRTTERKPDVEPAKDVMISYSHSDKAVMNQIREGLETAGLSVWVDVSGLKAGVDFLSEIGQAIIDAKMVVSVLSARSVVSRYCQDELALAYVSNKPIFPVGLEDPKELFPKMDTGMKLQLAGFVWELFLDENKLEDNLAQLVARMKEALGRDVDDGGGFGSHTTSGGLEAAAARAGKDDIALMQFWQRHWAGREKLTADEFLDTFFSEYAAELSALVSQADRDWVGNVIRRGLKVHLHDGNVTLDNYEAFCTEGGVRRPFLQRVTAECVEGYTMKEVFDMDSSVRVQAIENLGKFNSPAVVEALLDLLSDSDKNVQVVACISIAKTGTDRADVAEKLITCLGDPDRLVRESACLALGHLKVTAAVTKIVHLWRNDYISSVRDAASAALAQIGGQEANKAMHMTSVLAEEIRTLTQ